jgi:heme oxygenase
VSSTPLERSFREEVEETTMGETTGDASVIDASSGEAALTDRKRALERSGDDPTFSSPVRKKQGRPAKTASHEGQFTAAKRRERALQKEEEIANEGAKRAFDMFRRADGNRAIKVRRLAEKENHRMKMDPTVDIAAQVHQGLETLIKAVESSKSLR